MNKIKIGVSACLTGDEVRYNGQGSEDKFLNRELSTHFDFVKVCPEVGIGLSIPRETIRLVRKNDEVRLVNHGGDKDFTDKMQDFSAKSAERIKKERISGFVFKKNSPSCGAFRVKVYNEKGVTQHNGSMGMYAKYIQEKFPWLPVEEDGRLNDPGLRHNFISRVHAMKKWQDTVEDNLCMKSLINFHKTHKYMLMSYSQLGLKELGRLVANGEGRAIEDIAHEYLLKFAALTAKPAPRSKHVNVLFHLMGYFSQKLDEFDRKEIVSVITNYKDGLVPLVLPVRAVSHYIKKFKVEYLMTQSYLDYPEDLCVLNRL